jgi:hypothetical protein
MMAKIILKSALIGMMLIMTSLHPAFAQEQLAGKCGTTKTYISRIENNAGDIRLSTLMRIISKGFGKRLSVSVEN